MTSEQFAYWLQGHIEMNPGRVPSAEQWEMIAQHLATVFIKVTPPLPDFPGQTAIRSLEYRLADAIADKHFSHMHPWPPVITC